MDDAEISNSDDRRLDVVKEERTRKTDVGLTREGEPLRAK